jgi:hypothetical protein
MLWVVLLLNARGTARLVLHPWRQNRGYGFWLLGLATGLVVLLEVGLEPFATQVEPYWTWRPTRLPPDWYSAPLVNFLAWAVVSLLLLVFVTPALLNKKPVKLPPDFHPLVVWTLLNVLFLTGALTHHLRAAALVVAAQTVGVGVAALYGGMKRET